MRAAILREAADQLTGTARWSRLWQALAGVAPSGLHQSLLGAYAEDQRHYHTLVHLQECLALLDSWRAFATYPMEVELALWFHDAVYDVHHHDNEQRSADWAGKVLTDCAVDDAVIARVRALILATSHEAEALDRDQQLLIDIDLAILGASRARFEQYESQIRQEYAHVEEAAFRRERGRLLKQFLERPRLYATGSAFAAFEARARDNLRRSISLLGGG